MWFQLWPDPWEEYADFGALSRFQYCSPRGKGSGLLCLYDNQSLFGRCLGLEVRALTYQVRQIHQRRAVLREGGKLWVVSSSRFQQHQG